MYLNINYHHKYDKGIIWCSIVQKSEVPAQTNQRWSVSNLFIRITSAFAGRNRRSSKRMWKLPQSVSHFQGLIGKDLEDQWSIHQDDIQKQLNLRLDSTEENMTKNCVYSISGCILCHIITNHLHTVRLEEHKKNNGEAIKSCMADYV